MGRLLVREGDQEVRRTEERGFAFIELILEEVHVLHDGRMMWWAWEGLEGWVLKVSMKVNMGETRCCAEAAVSSSARSIGQAVPYVNSIFTSLLQRDESKNTPCCR